MRAQDLWLRTSRITATRFALLGAPALACIFLLFAQPTEGASAPAIEEAPGLVFPLQVIPDTVDLVAHQPPDTLWFIQNDGLYRWKASSGTPTRVPHVSPEVAQSLIGMIFAADRLWLYSFPTRVASGLHGGTPSTEGDNPVPRGELEIISFEPSTSKVATIARIQEFYPTLYPNGPTATEDEYNLIFRTTTDTIAWSKALRTLTHIPLGNLITTAGVDANKTWVLTTQGATNITDRAIPAQLCREASLLRGNKPQCIPAEGFKLTRSDGEHIWFLGENNANQLELHQLDLTSWKVTRIATISPPPSSRSPATRRTREPQSIDAIPSPPFLFVQFGKSLHRINLSTHEVTSHPSIPGTDFVRILPSPLKGRIQIYVSHHKRDDDAPLSVLYEWGSSDLIPTFNVEKEGLRLVADTKQRLWAFSRREVYYRDTSEGATHRLQWEIPAEFGRIQNAWPLGRILVIKVQKGANVTYHSWSPDTHLDVELLPDRGGAEGELNSVIEAFFRPITGERLPIPTGYRRISVEHQPESHRPVGSVPANESTKTLVNMTENPSIKRTLIPIEDFRYRFDLAAFTPYRHAELYIQGRDRFGNTFHRQLKATVLPGPTIFWSMAYVAYGFLALGFILAAPWLRFANTVVMSPVVRK